MTHNLRDFPKEALAPFNIQAQAPDHFLTDLFDFAPDVLTQIVLEQASDLRKPPQTVDRVLTNLEQHAPRFVHLVRLQVLDLHISPQAPEETTQERKEGLSNRPLATKENASPQSTDWVTQAVQAVFDWLKASHSHKNARVTGRRTLPDIIIEEADGTLTGVDTRFSSLSIPSDLTFDLSSDWVKSLLHEDINRYVLVVVADEADAIRSLPGFKAWKPPVATSVVIGYVDSANAFQPVFNNYFGSD